MIPTHTVYPFGRPPDGLAVLWRCEAQSYSVCIDPDADRYGSTPPRLEMRWYQVDRGTPKGAWIGDKLVRLYARKRWACPTEEEALESFIARRQRQIKIVSKQLRRAEAELALAYPKTFALAVA
jgi:hypothetical protein